MCDFLKNKKYFQCNFALKNNLIFPPERMILDVISLYKQHLKKLKFSRFMFVLKGFCFTRYLQFSRKNMVESCYPPCIVVCSVVNN